MQTSHHRNPLLMSCVPGLVIIKGRYGDLESAGDYIDVTDPLQVGASVCLSLAFVSLSLSIVFSTFY